MEEGLLSTGPTPSSLDLCQALYPHFFGSNRNTILSIEVLKDIEREIILYLICLILTSDRVQNIYTPLLDETYMPFPVLTSGHI